VKIAKDEEVQIEEWIKFAPIMEVKNLFDPTVKEEIISRINNLKPATQRKWGKWMWRKC